MPLDTNRGDGPPIRSFLGADWVVTARCYLGVVIVLLGVILAAVGAVVGDVPMLLSGVGTAVLGVFFVLVGCRLSTRQQQYLSRAERELLEIREYRAFLEDVAAERAGAGDESGSPPPPSPAEVERTAGDAPSGEGTAEPPSASGPPPLWELRSRLELAEEILEEAREAVYRRDYASFLSMYYEASRQEILLYDLLDEHADGWWFGLDADGTGGSDREVTAASVGVPHRRWNLSQRIRSFAEGSLPESRLALVRGYLGGPEDLPTPWQLYYAVRVLHEWNVGRYERALDVKRFLRGGILAMLVVLIGLGVVLPLTFPAGFLEPFGGGSVGNGTVTSGPGVVTNDGFLGLMVLAGALGAVFSLLLRSFGDFYTLTTDPTVPEPVFMLEALVARTLFGGVSALILFFVARTDLAAVVFTEALLTSPLSLLLLGFVAGLSEQLVKRSLNEVIENIGAEESPDEDAGAGRTAGATTATGSTASGEHLPVEVLRELTEEERSRDGDADEGASDAAADTSTADEPDEEDSGEEDPNEGGERDGER